MKQIPVLWIWDNVEPVAGFPAGTESAWSPREQKDLLGFLRALRETKARVLLTSRRDERSWLGDLPTRIEVPSMRMTESLQLARALAAKRRRLITDVEDWRPLLAFAQGNPMTLTAVARQALREGFKTKEQIQAFVARLRSGEAAFPDDASEGRSSSLGSSLAYGFEQAFNEEERKKLALLYLFQGFVDVDALRIMGRPEESWCLPEVRGLTREEGIALLDRTAEVGLLTAYADGYYGIHPALPWFFKDLFERCYPAKDLAAMRAFVAAMGELGGHYHAQYERGNHDVLGILRAEEANLLHARRVALAHDWWEGAISAMQGLDQFYHHTGRRAEWKRLVQEIVLDFVDPETDGPLPEQENALDVVTGYCVRLAREERQWTEAERLQIVRVDWSRQRAAPALVKPPEKLESGERHAIRSLAVSLHELGQIRREVGRADCVQAYQEALVFCEQIGDQTGAAACARNLGHAFKNLPALRDLDQAERWYRKSFDLADESDRLGRGRCMVQLGLVADGRFREVVAAERPKEELFWHFTEAVRFYLEALELLPPDAIDDMGVTHNALGAIYTEAGDFDSALPHYREAIQRLEQVGALFNASVTRFNVAVGFFNAGRQEDALDYAEAALRGFESYEERAAEMIETTRGLIAAIGGR